MAVAKQRCSWCGDDPLYVAYHDDEWGVPVHDDARLFEFLQLEGAQAGLSWITILRKREQYRAAFDGFDAEKIARYRKPRIERLLKNPGIVRNRLKVEGSVQSARAYLDLRDELGSFSNFLWKFVDGVPVRNRWPSMAKVPATTDASHAMSRALKRRGFKFVGPTICYAFMQAVGMVNDHLVECHRFAALDRAGRGRSFRSSVVAGRHLGE